MLEHTIFMLKNFYVTDTFVYGSYVCLIIAVVAVIDAILVAFVYIRDVKKQLAMIIGANKKL